MLTSLAAHVRPVAFATMLRNSPSRLFLAALPRMHTYATADLRTNSVAALPATGTIAVWSKRAFAAVPSATAAGPLAVRRERALATMPSPSARAAAVRSERPITAVPASDRATAMRGERTITAVHYADAHACAADRVWAVATLLTGLTP